MLNNITALNINEGYINNKKIKVMPGKHAKPAKLSSGQTFKTKSAAIMEKVNTVVAPTGGLAPDVASQPVVAPPPVETQAPISQAPTNVTLNAEPAGVTAVPQAPVATTNIANVNLPTDDKILGKITTLNISYVEPTMAKDAGSRRLKISSAVVTRTRNALRVMVSNNQPQPLETMTEDVPAPSAPVAMDTQVLSAPPPQELSGAVSEEVPASQAMEEGPNPASPDGGFFLGQKLNTETMENGETEVTPINDEGTLEDVPNSEITQEEKDERLNQFLNGNQGNIVDFSEAKKALEEIASRRNELSELEKEMEEARKIRETQNKELQQLLADAPKIIADLDKDKMSRTEELSNLRAEIIQYSDLIQQNRGFQGNFEENEEEESYERSKG